MEGSYIVRMSSLQTMNAVGREHIIKMFCSQPISTFTDDESYLRAVAYSELFVVVLLLFCVVQVDGMSKYATAGGSGEGLGACTI